MDRDTGKCPNKSCTFAYRRRNKPVQCPLCHAYIQGVSKKTHDQVFSSFDLITQAIYMQKNSRTPIFETETQRFVLNTEGNQEAKNFISKVSLYNTNYHNII